MISKKALAIILLLSYPLFAGVYVGIEGGYARNLGVFDIQQNNLKPINLKKESLRENGLVGNITAGTEHFFFNNYFGFRWGVFMGYGATWGKNDTYGNLSTQSSHIGVNADIFVNFIAKENLTAGIFVGMGYSYNIFKPNKNIKYGEHFSFKANIYYPPDHMIIPMVQHIEDDCFVNNKASYQTPILRVGTSVLLDKHHRIEILAKIPLTILERGDDFLYIYGDLYDLTYHQYDTKVSYEHSFLQAFVSYKYVF